MAWDENLTNLNYVLAGLYPLTEESYRIVDVAGIPKAQVAFKSRAMDNWWSILNEADKRRKVLDIIRATRKDYPENPFLIHAEQGELKSLRGPIMDKDLSWKSQQQAETLEKIMGKQSTLLPISFLEVGLDRSRSVARVRLESGIVGSGFLTENNIFVTNNHVIPTEDAANMTTVQFNYQQTADGANLEPVNFSLDPDSGFVTSEEDDWTLVRVQGDANTEWGVIKVNLIDIKETSRVNIIQHPGGNTKQVALYHNIVAYVDDKRVQYLTDTLPGSSGSPVFDSQWRVIALHHSGGWVMEPGTKKTVYRNEGININRIAQGLEESGLLK